MTKPTSRVTARNALLLNLLGTPGLGTWMAGRRITGLLQAGMAVTGFALVMVWFVQWCVALLHGGRAAHLTYRGLGLGSGLFALAWGWSLISGLQILRQSPRSPPAAGPQEQSKPPKLG
jgi:hypothetical protein